MNKNSRREGQSKAGAPAVRPEPWSAAGGAV